MLIFFQEGQCSFTFLLKVVKLVYCSWYIASTGFYGASGSKRVPCILYLVVVLPYFSLFRCALGGHQFCNEFDCTDKSDSKYNHAITQVC